MLNVIYRKKYTLMLLSGTLYNFVYYQTSLTHDGSLTAIGEVFNCVTVANSNSFTLS